MNRVRSLKDTMSLSYRIYGGFMQHRKNVLLKYCVLTAGIFISAGAPHARESVKLTLDTAVDIAMGKSYRIKQLQMGVERSRYSLQARQASLKSRVYMNLKTPEYKAVSENKWNSTLKKDEIVRENTRLWQMDLAVRQPVLFLGYPTNGYLSLNNQMYKYLQKDGVEDVNYYNRYYVKYEQPFFLPNTLKNNTEDAELDLERRELEYIRDRVWLINSVADDFYDLFEYTYYDDIYEKNIEALNTVADIANGVASRDTTRAIERIQVQVELANVREQRLKNQSNIRREGAGLKQRLRMSHEDSIYVEPAFPFKPVEVDVERAVEYGYSLSPTQRMLNIDRRKNEIDLDNVTGSDAFHLNMEMTYGLEKQEDRHQEMWDEYDNSYSALLNAYIPIWDWGRRKARIEAERIDLKQTELRIEENRTQIYSDIVIAVQNLLEYQERTKNMMESLEMAREITAVSIEQYRTNAISLQDALQIIIRQRETEINFFEAYQGYRRSLLSLMVQTYYDYENDISLIDKFRSDG